MYIIFYCKVLLVTEAINLNLSTGLVSKRKKCLRTSFVYLRASFHFFLIKSGPGKLLRGIRHLFHWINLVTFEPSIEGSVKLVERGCEMERRRQIPHANTLLYTHIFSSPGVFALLVLWQQRWRVDALISLSSFPQLLSSQLTALTLVAHH